MLAIKGLQKQMLFYIAFISIVFITMTVEMTAFLNGSDVLGRLVTIAGEDASNEIVHVILLKTGLMVMVFLLSIGVIMVLFTKKIMIPLSKILDAVRLISDGDLSVTVPEYTKDELGELAARINELSANYQELMLLSKDITARMKDVIHSDSPDIGQIDELRTQLDEIIDEFGMNFYK